MTTLASSRIHATAIVTLLTAGGLTTYLSDADDAAPGTYVVVHPSPGSYAGAMGDRFQELLLSFQTTCVGVGPEQALATHDAAGLILAGGIPTIAGRTVHPIWLDEDPQPIRRDDTLEQPLFYAVARWVLHTSA